MVITKTKTKIFTPIQVGIDFLTHDESYRKIRKGFKYQGFSCFNCNKHFEDNEKISLVRFKESLNKMVCKKCGEIIKKDINET